MKTVTRIAGWIVAGAGGFLLALELLLQFLPVAGRGAYAADPDPRWPEHRLRPHGEFVSSMSWSLRHVNRGATNNLGYVSPFDYVDGPTDIVVLGDSYIESLMNPYADTLQGQLPALLSRPATVLGFGMSGYSMPDYLAVAHLVGQRFPPRWAIVLLSARDFDEGFSAGPGYAKWNPSSDSLVTVVPEARPRWRNVLRTSSVVRYLRGNLKVEPARLLRPPVWGEAAYATRSCARVDLRHDDARLAERFLERFPRELGIDAGHVILLFDADRRSIYERHEPCPTRDSAAQQLMRTLAAERGMTVIDLDEAFRSAIRSGVKLDYYPLDLHWNAHAHGIAAALVARTLNVAERAPSGPDPD